MTAARSPSPPATRPARGCASGRRSGPARSDEPWPAAVRQAMRRAVGLAMTEQPEATLLRARLTAEVPAVRSRMPESLSATGRLVAEAVARRTGPDPDGLEVRVCATAPAGGLLEASRYTAERGHTDDLADLVDRAPDVFEHGPPARKSRGPAART
ncbi:acyl-CoA-like ligand-binding transcription factor [Streptomyces pilosus]|nr:hypothetical protein [Streptomyces pilosus]